MLCRNAATLLHGLVLALLARTCFPFPSFVQLAVPRPGATCAESSCYVCRSGGRPAITGLSMVRRWELGSGKPKKSIEAVDQGSQTHSSPGTVPQGPTNASGAREDGELETLLGARKAIRFVGDNENAAVFLSMLRMAKRSLLLSLQDADGEVSGLAADLVEELESVSPLASPTGAPELLYGKYRMAGGTALADQGGGGIVLGEETCEVEGPSAVRLAGSHFAVSYLDQDLLILRAREEPLDPLVAATTARGAVTVLIKDK